MIMKPHGWVKGYSADLEYIICENVKEYPQKFDDYYWNSKEFPLIGVEQANKLLSVFSCIENEIDRKLEIAIKRLNNSIQRSNEEDALLDSIIGIETLLSDGDKGELTYKLSMRTAALLNKFNSYDISSYEIFLVRRAWCLSRR